MPGIPQILLKLCYREDLTRDEARDAFEHIMSGHATEAQIGGLLVGLAAKGTTVEELVGAATVMREKAIPIACAAPMQAGPERSGTPRSAGPDPHHPSSVIIDTCGTGGDVRGTFNISTAAAIIV